MNRIIATRSAEQIKAIINGQSFDLTAETKEEAVEIYKQILEVKKDATDEKVDKLKAFLSPSYKINKALDGSVTKDRLGNYYMGSSIPLPYALKEVVKEYIEDDIDLTPLKRFWQLLCLNPNPHVIESAFKFMSRFNMPITDNGYFIAYKSVAWKGEENKSLGVFISQQYVNMKASGKDISEMIVIKMGTDHPTFECMTQYNYVKWRAEMVENDLPEYRCGKAWEFLENTNKMSYITAQNNCISDEDLFELCEQLGYQEPAERELMTALDSTLEIESLGSLENLFKNMSDLFDFDSPTFTDWHTKRSTIVLGEPVTMDMDDCDTNPNNTCSSGLHVGAPGYVSKFGYGEDNYILACLVNPMNIAAIPYDYDFEKMRTCEYLPYAVCEFEDGKIKELDTKYFEEDYINYEVESLNDLSKELKNLDLNQEEIKERKSLISNRLTFLGQ